MLSIYSISYMQNSKKFGALRREKRIHQQEGVDENMLSNGSEGRNRITLRKDIILKNLYRSEEYIR